MAIVPSSVSSTDVTNQINTQVPSLISTANGVVKIASNAANQTVTNTATLVDGTGLNFNATPGVYYVKAALGYTTTAVQGVKQALSGTATVTTTSVVHSLYNTNTAGLGSMSRVTAMSTPIGATGIGLAVVGEIEGTIRVTVAGTIQIQFSGQSASVGSDTTLLADSYLLYVKLS